MSNILERKKDESSIDIFKNANPKTSTFVHFAVIPFTGLHPSALEKPYDIQVPEFFIDFANEKEFNVGTKTYSLTSTEVLEDYPNSNFAKIASKFLATKKLSLSQSGWDILNNGEAAIPFIDFSVTQKMTREEFGAFAGELQNIVSKVLKEKKDYNHIAKDDSGKDIYDCFFANSRYRLNCTYYLDAENTTNNLISFTLIDHEKYF